MVEESRTAPCTSQQHLRLSWREFPSLDRIITSNITAVAFSVLFNETFGFFVGMFLCRLSNQSTVGGRVRYTRNITGAKDANAGGGGRGADHPSAEG